MALDDASYSVLWDIFHETGVRPEWLLPVLQAESGLRPDIQNQAGEPFYGLNQISKKFLDSIGVTPQDYLTWPASRQLETVVLPYVKSQVASYGPIRSGVRLYQANFLPATLSFARKLSDTITSAPSPFYTHNSGLDAQKKGYITVQDLANFVSRAAAAPAVKDAIKRAYTESCAVAVNGIAVGAPSDCVMPDGHTEDPVYGEDFVGVKSPTTSGNENVVAAVSVVILFGAVAYGIANGVFDKPLRWLQRRLVA
jgi:hypothetical protein